MRKFYVITIFTLAIFASLFSGCEKESKVIYNFSVVSQYGCGFHAHDFDIQYSVGGSSIKDLDVSATADDAWVTNIDSSAPNLLRISVAENDGEQRSTIIRLNAPGMHEARITITQMAAPKSGVSHTLIFYFFGGGGAKANLPEIQAVLDPKGAAMLIALLSVSFAFEF